MRPYIFWTPTDFATHLKTTAISLGMGKYIITLIEEAVLSHSWYAPLDYKGCHGIRDIYHPCISCFIHEYLRMTGQGGQHADELFYFLMLKEGLTKKHAKKRWLKVRTIWFLYYKWVHLKNRNVSKYSNSFMNALDALKHDYGIKKAYHGTDYS